MPKHRQSRINEEMKREISDIIRTDLNDPRISTMASVVAVEVTPDLRFAKVFISVLGNDQEKSETIKGLVSAAGFVRREVGERMQLRHTPEMHFTLDTSIEHGASILKLLKEINKNSDGGETI